MLSGLDVIIFAIMIFFVSGEESDLDFMGFVNFDVPHMSNDEGPTLEENWVNAAVLDVAYYLRSHKFNEYDRRLKPESNSVRNLFAKFPDPPLRSLHWEASYNCEEGLISCLKYLRHTLLESRLSRSMDTITLMRKHGWTWEKNRDVIERTDEECRNIFDMDSMNPEPFLGPLQRFQFRVTASYYMCMFTMQRQPELSMFGEPCDNFASCLINRTFDSTGDPRANDRIPFACAFYSFCPDPCCPVKVLKTRTKIASCGDHPENPCIKYLGNTTTDKNCSLDAKLNTDFASLMLNHWNTTCHCGTKGYEWDSRFASCVDKDECAAQTGACDPETEVCYNLEGTHACGCARGYWYDKVPKKCVPIPFMDQIRDNFNPKADGKVKSPVDTSGWQSKFPLLFNITEKLLHLFLPRKTKSEKVEEFPKPLQTDGESDDTSFFDS